MKYTSLYNIFILSLILFSCKNEIELDENIESNKNEIEFSLSIDGRSIDYGYNGEDVAGDKEILSKYFISGKSCVLISQRSQNLSVNFNEGEPNCYKYVYNENPAANWENDKFNFTSVNPMSWDKIISNGDFEGNYALCALFYPGGNDNENYVLANQSQEESFFASDILGTWHKTESEGERLRFQLYHLMCYLYVELYVPVWDGKTGFFEDALDVAKALSLRTDFNIEWPKQSSEKAPLASPSNQVSGNVSDITMHENNRDSNEMELSLSDFGIQDMEADKVRKYSLGILFPQQTVNNDFLKFTLKRGESFLEYVFKVTNTAPGNSITFKPGEITRLKLYVPRTDNDILLIKAEIIKWEDAEASFTITKDPAK